MIRCDAIRVLTLGGGQDTQNTKAFYDKIAGAEPALRFYSPVESYFLIAESDQLLPNRMAGIPAHPQEHQARMKLWLRHGWQPRRSLFYFSWIKSN